MTRVRTQPSPEQIATVMAWAQQQTDLDETYLAACVVLELARQRDRAEAALQKMKEERDTPEIADFMKAVPLEAVHQQERWGSDHDTGKSPEDWLWLLAYLSTKAAQAARYGDREKYLHHIITCAAACANWHAVALGEVKS